MVVSAASLGLGGGKDLSIVGKASNICIVRSSSIDLSLSVKALDM